MYYKIEREIFMAKKKITDTVEELLAGFLKDEDYELYNCEYHKGRQRLVPAAFMSTRRLPG